MIRAAIFIGLFVLSLGIGHGLVLWRAPAVFMTLAMERIAEQGVGLHAFVLAPEVTPQSQSVVRPAPDLAYSVCRFDLSKGHVLARGAVSDGYGSLSVFDGNTNNVVTLSLMSSDDGPRAVELALSGSSLSNSEDVRFIKLSSPKGLVLIRRLAPDDMTRSAVEEISDLDECRMLSAP